MSRWLFLFLFVSPGLAEAEPYGLAVVDEVKGLERPALERAAAPLLKRGAAVAVVLVRHGGKPDAARQLAQLGLLNRQPASRLQHAGYAAKEDGASASPASDSNAGGGSYEVNYEPPSASTGESWSGGEW